MSNNFNIGEIAILQNCHNPALNGCECEITGLPEILRAWNDNELTARYRITTSADTNCNVCMPHQLKKLDDGNEASSWEDCVWQPNKQLVDS